MEIYFLDSSAIVKRYVRETGTEWVNQITDPANGHFCAISRIAGVEVIAALTRRSRVGTLSTSSLHHEFAVWERDFDNQFEIIEVTPELIERAILMARSHTLRAYDAVQLASALWLQENIGTPLNTMTLVSADQELNAAAEAEGFNVEDPNNHP